MSILAYFIRKILAKISKLCYCQQQPRVFCIIFAIRITMNSGVVVKMYCLSVFLLLTKGAFGQAKISVKLTAMDFGVWAYQQHNALCATVYEKVRTGQLPVYNSQNVKESGRVAFNHMTPLRPIVDDDPTEPVMKKDTVVNSENPLNYFLFKIAKDYVLLKPFKDNNALIRFNKNEFTQALNEDERFYLQLFTSLGALNIDSIPEISWRHFTRLDKVLFEYSKSTGTTLFKDDSLKYPLNEDEKFKLRHFLVVRFMPADPENPLDGKDTAIFEPFNPADTLNSQSIIITMQYADLKLQIKTFSVGMQYRNDEQPTPYGYLPDNDYLPWSLSEREWVKAILSLRIQMLLNEDADLTEQYREFFDL